MPTTAAPKRAKTAKAAPKRKPAAASRPAAPKQAAAKQAAPKQAERYVLVPLVDRARDAVARLEREVQGTRRQLDRRGRAARTSIGGNLGGISDRVENVVQNGVNAGMKLVNGAQARIKKAA